MGKGTALLISSAEKVYWFRGWHVFVAHRLFDRSILGLMVLKEKNSKDRGRLCLMLLLQVRVSGNTSRHRNGKIFANEQVMSPTSS